MTYGSLFSGIGGIDLGLTRAGWQCKWQVENDPYCNQILQKHWPSVKRYGDIRSLSGSELAPVDCIAGGFPCQDLSQAGKRAGIEGARSGLWFEFARLVGELGPRYVLIENVPGLLVPGAMRRVVGELARLGYVGCWRSLRASEFGASHLRKRIFIVAYSTAAGSSPAMRSGEAHANGRTNLFEPSGDYLAHGEHEGRIPGGASHHGNGSDASGDHVNGCDPQLEHAACPQQPRSTGFGNYRERRPPQGLDPRSIGPFAPGPSDPRWPGILRERPDLAPALESPVCGVAPRLSSDLERAMSDRTKRLGRLGNSVVPQVAEWVAERINRFESGEMVRADSQSGKDTLHREEGMASNAQAAIPASSADSNRHTLRLGDRCREPVAPR